MSNYPYGVPPDDPNLEIYEHAHSVDRDIASTNLAISIHRAAVAVGHPDNPDAARMSMTGPAAAAAVQATMNPFVDKAITFDEDAVQYAVQALECANQAQAHTDQRARLRQEPVTLADGSSQTRGQVQDGHAQRMEAAAQRVGRGDTEHLARIPSPGVRLTVTTVLSTIELGLLIWPVTDASWSDPKSVAYVAGLAVMFLLMNDQLPRHAGRAWREHREITHAARELTAVAISTGRSGDTDGGRKIAGHVDSRHVRAGWRKAVLWTALIGVIMTVYAAVMFTRVLRMAGPLGSPVFSFLAAALVTAFTVGAPIMMAVRWSRGNALGDELREYGAITAASREMAQDLEELAEEAATTSAQIAELACDQLERANQRIHDGYRVVAVGLQKAARMLGLDTVVTPDPANLFPAERALRARALDSIAKAGSIIAGVQRTLAEPGPFAAEGPPPNPWHHRTAPRRAMPDPAHMDPSQTGPLHEPPPRRRAGSAASS